MGLAVVSKGIPMAGRRRGLLAIWLWREGRLRELLVATAASDDHRALDRGTVLDPGPARASRRPRPTTSCGPLQLESTAAAIRDPLRATVDSRRSTSYGSINLVGAAARTALACTGPATLAFLLGALVLVWRSLARAEGPVER